MPDDYIPWQDYDDPCACGHVRVKHAAPEFSGHCACLACSCEYFQDARTEDARALLIHPQHQRAADVMWRVAGMVIFTILLVVLAVLAKDRLQ